MTIELAYRLQFAVEQPMAMQTNVVRFLELMELNDEKTKN